MSSLRGFLIVLAAWVVGATALLSAMFGTAPAAPSTPAAQPGAVVQPINPIGAWPIRGHVELSITPGGELLLVGAVQGPPEVIAALPDGRPNIWWDIPGGEGRCEDHLQPRVPPYHGLYQRYFPAVERPGYQTFRETLSLAYWIGRDGALPPPRDLALLGVFDRAFGAGSVEQAELFGCADIPLWSLLQRSGWEAPTTSPSGGGAGWSELPQDDPR